MNIIENEIIQTKNKTELLEMKIIEQKELITTLERKNTKYQNTIKELKETIHISNLNKLKIGHKLDF